MTRLPLAAFTQETNLGAEHRRLMDSGHRSVRWERSTAAALPDDLRVELAELWRARMVSEHRSVGIFATYTLDLLGAGAPAEVLSLACRAALDEVRHAELFARLTSLYSGAVETPPPGVPPMPDDASIPLGHQVAREALHLAVAAETYSAVVLSELHARATDPVVLDVLAVVLSDEIHHARMGWAFLATLLTGPEAPALALFIQAELGPLFNGLSRSLFGDDPAALPPPSSSEDRRALAAQHGHLSRRDERALYQATIDDVWIPGLTRLGLDASALRAEHP